jgi:26S proteasome regulatory subunit T5
MIKLPYLVANVNEIIELPEDTEVAEEMTEPKPRAIIKTSERTTVYLQEIGYVKAEDLKPGDLVGVNKDNFLIMEKLPPEYDSRVMAMEVR